jgi:WD40 repeat protein
VGDPKDLRFEVLNDRVIFGQRTFKIEAAAFRTWKWNESARLEKISFNKIRTKQLDLQIDSQNKLLMTTLSDQNLLSLWDINSEKEIIHKKLPEGMHGAHLRLSSTGHGILGLPNVEERTPVARYWPIDGFDIHKFSVFESSDYLEVDSVVKFTKDDRFVFASTRFTSSDAVGIWDLRSGEFLATLRFTQTNGRGHHREYLQDVTDFWLTQDETEIFTHHNGGLLVKWKLPQELLDLMKRH